MAIKELVTNALADNIDQMRSNFNTEVSGLLAAKMNERKQEIAKSYFGQTIEEPKAQ